MRVDRPRTGLEIAIVGLAGRFPGAANPDELWHNLSGGVESVCFFSDEELLAAGLEREVLADPSYVKARAVLDGADLFDAALFGYSPREAELLDPQHRIFLECAWEALENAGHAPEAFPGPIGIYAGVGQSWYFMSHVLPKRDMVRAVGLFQSLIGSGTDFLTTRVSYKLGLSGPSLAVQTACSTSLVATHLACQALLSGECDMALAGGVSVRVPQRTGYLYQEGGIASPDGHCRAFDTRAAGTVSGDGVGVVVLRRLEDALADRDAIRAVILGSAVNNDGSYRVGYTAPSVDGQARVIRAALAAASVDPETITYVEAHGSATSLGDPTEVAALVQSYCNGQPRKRRSCALGSVKTNIGHVDAAAGVAGLIKTVLALEHRQLPPSLHFETPHPEIDFDEGPFYVNSRLASWEANGEPRRAGVSSFGLGGTNAHVVLEEAPEPALSGPSRSSQLLVLSARTPSALESATAQLATYLRQSPGIELADVAYTLQTGRQSLPYRRMLVARDAGDAAAVLDSGDPRRLLMAERVGGGREVAFLFSGLGEQYLGMARELYAGEPTFRAELDRCCDLLQPLVGCDLRGLLYPPEGAEPATGAMAGAGAGTGGLDLRTLVRGGRRPADPAASPLNRTLYAHTTLFAVGWALSRLWMEWGIRPAAMMGYSLGEYLAACLAGVFSLEDAVRVVAGRAQLIEELPPGAMLAVPLTPEELSPRLNKALSLAAVNAPSLCVISGEEEAVLALESELAGRGVSTRRLAACHGFHSAMMEPIAERFAAVLRNVPLHPPAIPYLSNVTGTWIRPDEATDPQYWVRHLCGTVHFSAAVSELLQDPATALLEIGPGRTLGTFVLQHADPAAGRVVLNSLRGPDEGVSDTAHLLTSLGRLWLSGARLHWRGFSRHERRRRVRLPGYPFERRRFWIEATPLAPATAGAAAPAQPASPAEAAPGEVAPPLLHLRPSLGSLYVAPTNATETVIIEIWQELLGVRPIGIHDSFFELGGHSLLATQVVARLQQTFGVEVPLRALTDAPTPAALAVLVEERRTLPAARPRPPLPRIQPDPEHLHEPFPLTDVQEAYWIGRSAVLQLGNVATHTYIEQDIVDLDVERYQFAWRRLIERHGMLRAVFLPDGRQQILAEVPPFEIDILDLRGRPRAEAEEELAAIRRRMSHQVLPSDRWPLFEIRVARLDDRRVRLYASFDFLIFDAWSADLLNQELKVLNEDPAAELPPLTISFRDYVLTERTLRQTEYYEHSRRYWLDRLPALPPAPELPLAKNPAEITKPRFASRNVTLDRDAWAVLKRHGERRGLTPTGLIIAIFSEVLAAWTKNPRFTLNLTLFNRLPLHPEVNAILGDFSSLSLLAVDTGAGETFEERARRVQLQLWDDLDHRFYSGVQVMRDLARVRGSLASALMPVVVTSTISLLPYEEAPRPVDKENRSDDVYRISQTPQVWLDHQIIERGGALVFNWDTVDELFPAGMLDEMFAAFAGLLRRLAEDESAWRERRFALLPAQQLAVRAAVNATEAPLPGGLLHDPFLRQAAAQPERPAVIAPGRTITYGELASAAARLAGWLRRQGAEPNRLVAIVMEKGWEQAAAALGVLRGGAAYLPIDPSLPPERFRYLLEHGEVRCALTQPGLLETLRWPEGVERRAVVEADLAAGAEELPPAPQRPEDLAYVIYTSGSTGLPKGVMIDHRGALNTVFDINRRFSLDASDRVLALSSLSFDLSVYDLFGTFAAGGAVVLPSPGTVRDPAAWAELMVRERVTVWNSVPALLGLFVEYAEKTGAGGLDALRLALLSGDWIPVTLPDRLRALAPGARVVSLGGATEASIWSIFYPIAEVDPAWSSIPYGQPLANQHWHVLDDDLEPRPVWVPGQLYIGGDGLALGYWRDEEKTAASFLVHPRSGERLYRTGDLGRYLPDGTLEFLGREDTQIKIHGYRVELGEIEATLAQHPAVVAAAAVAVGEDRTSLRLAAYAVPAPGTALTADEIRGFLADRLPAYMLPATLGFLPSLPLTANGKVDRAALLQSASAAVTAADAPLAATAHEAASPLAVRVARVVAEAFRLDRVDLDAGFLELGGTSIEIIRLATLLATEFHDHPPIEQLFTVRNVRALVDYYASRAPKPAVADAPLARPQAAHSEAPYYRVILDPGEREELKKRRLGLRPPDPSRASLALPGPSREDETARRWPERRSVRRFASSPLPFANLAGLLGGLRDLSAGAEPRYRYASAGGVYPVQLYLHVKPGRVDGLGHGIYYYEPQAHRLEALAPEAEIDRSVHGWINLPVFDQAAFSLFLVARLAAIGPMYGPVARDYCLIEAGLMSQLLESGAAAHDIGLCQIGVGGLEFERIRHLFHLAEDHLLVHSLLGGPLDPSLGEAAYTPALFAQEWEEGEL